MGVKAAVLQHMVGQKFVVIGSVGKFSNWTELPESSANEGQNTLEY
jgi:hypothetical protein